MSSFPRKRESSGAKVTGSPLGRSSKLAFARFRGDDIGPFCNQFLEAVSELHAENVDRAFISSDELPVARRRCRIGLIDRGVLDKQMRVPEVERTVLRQLVLAAKRQPQAIVVGQPCGPVSVVDRCLVEREAHLRGGRGRKEEARLIFLSIVEYKEPFPLGSTAARSRGWSAFKPCSSTSNHLSIRREEQRSRSEAGGLFG